MITLYKALLIINDMKELLDINSHYLACENNKSKLRSQNKTTINIVENSKAINHTLFVYIVKVILTVTLSLFMCIMLQLGGIETIIAAAVVAIGPNLGASSGTLIYRFYGIVVGWFLGLIISIINAQFQSLSLLLILFGITIFLLTRTSLLYPKYNYICAQAGLLLVLMLITGCSNPAFEESFQRLLGVFLGGGIAIFILLIFRPQKPSIILRTKINSIMLEQLFFLSFLPSKIYNPHGDEFKALDEKIKSAELAISHKGNLNENIVKDKAILVKLNNIQLHLKLIARIINTSRIKKREITGRLYRSLIRIKISDFNSIYKIQADNFNTENTITLLRLVNIKYSIDKIIKMREQLYQELIL